jgi:hypothetical protein
MAQRDADYNFAHAYLCEGMMRPWAQVAEVVDPPDPWPPWSPIFNVDICPDWALPWLAQIVGIILPSSISPTDARTVMKALSNMARGGPDAIKTVAGLFLTGSKSMFFRERDGGDAYVLEIVSLNNETPDPSAVRRAILTQKPGGIVLNYRTVDTWDHEALASYHYLHKNLHGLYPTHRDLKRGPVA